MLIESTELTLAHVGLGRLHECAALALFASAQAHALTANSGGTLADVRDAEGRPLYPGYYMTHLRVPPERTLGTHGVWDKLSVGVEVRCYGGVLLDSDYLLGSETELRAHAAGQKVQVLPTMHASSMFVLQESPSREQQLAKPRAGALAQLEAMKTPPASMERFRRARAEGRFDAEQGDGWLTGEPALLPVVAGRDAAPGHNMMFAKFSELMGLAERSFLSRQHGFPTALLDCLTTLERETYYFANVSAGETVHISLRAQLSGPRPGTAKENSRGVLVGRVRFSLELTCLANNELLALSHAEHAFEVPSAQQSVMRSAERMLCLHARISSTKKESSDAKSRADSQ